LYRYCGDLVATYNKYGNKISHINTSIKPHIRGVFCLWDDSLGRGDG